MFFISKKYSSSIDFSEKGIEEAKEALERIYTFYDKLKEKNGDDGKDEFYNFVEDAERDFIDAIEDDLDTPRALAVLFEFIRKGNKYLSGNAKKGTLNRIKNFMDSVFFILGITGKEEKETIEFKKVIEILLVIRNELRKRKDYELSDKIRKKLNEIGVEIKDENGKSSYKLKR